MNPPDAPLGPPDDIPAVSAENLIDGELPREGETGRRYPSTLGGGFYLLVLTATLIGLGLVVWGSWRTGVRWIGGSLLFAALVRTVLSPRDAGMLAVRHKAVDAVMLAGVGAVLVFLANSIPNQPG